MASIIEAIGKHSREIGDKVCLIDGDLHLSYSTFFSYICGFSSYLRSKGVIEGAYVIVRTTQTASYFITGAAIQLIGAVFVPVERRISQGFLEEIISLTGARLMISPMDEKSDIKVIE